jgi:hypothetical protein
MYSGKKKTKAQRAAAAGTLTAAAVLLGVGIWRLDSGVRADLQRQAETSVKDAVLAAAVQCYAVEGSYPANLAYLQQTYGLQLNQKRFYVDYSVYASNQLPDVQVLSKS